jgi:hypothetical protein
MAITFDYSDSNNHIQALTAQVKTLIDVDYDFVDANNVEAFRVAAKAVNEPVRSKLLHMLNFIVFNSQVNSVYGDEQ